MIILLDNIRSSHNVGSIFRTADAVGGIEKIILGGVTPGPRDRFGLENIALTKVSLGAEKTIPWEQTPTVVDAVMTLKEKGYMIIALERTVDAVSIFDLPETLRAVASEKRVLLLGSETDGVSADLLRQADHVVAIPMRGEKESLNVAVAFGIAAYAISGL